MRIRIDFETRSTVDLRTRGSTIYAQHWTTAPLMLAIEVDGKKYLIDFMTMDMAPYVFPGVQREDDPQLWGRAPALPALLQQAINEDWTFVAHNSRFEQDIWYWVCVMRWGWPMPRKWSCTAARSAYWGIRRSLAGSGSDLEIQDQKFGEGDDLIKVFCIPRKYKGPKKNGIITQLWAEPWEQPEAYERFKQYCLQDVNAEIGIDNILPDLPEFEQRVWDLDFQINTHGVPIDLDNVSKAVHFSDHYTQHAVQRFNAITSVNPTQRDRVLEYLNQREEMEKLPNLRTKTLNRIVQDTLPHDLKDVINIRLDAARASVKKLEAMQANTSDDGFARGLFMYYGAHTGRWSGKRLQPQNFIRGDKDHMDVMFNYLGSDVWGRGIGNDGNPQWVNHADLLFPRPLKSLSHSMRGFIKAPDGQHILSGDYSQIEARVLAWLAGCEPLLNSFATGEDVYVRFAADHMYRRRYEEYFGPDGKVLLRYGDERQRAKSAVLGAGFQLGGLGFQAYCDNLDIIITEEEAHAIIKAYRDAYPELSDWNSGLWSRANYCAIQAVQNEGAVVPLYGTTVSFQVVRLDSERYWLLCYLPSGRHIAYYRPKTDTVNQYGRTVLTYRTEWMGKAVREPTYGGKIVENIVQAIARDICAQGALNIRDAGYNIFALIHDEVVALLNRGINIDEACRSIKTLLLAVGSIYAGLPLDAEVKAMVRYTK